MIHKVVKRKQTIDCLTEKNCFHDFWHTKTILLMYSEYLHYFIKKYFRFVSNSTKMWASQNQRKIKEKLIKNLLM